MSSHVDAPVYLVTAAGRGIGAACARLLAASGARLVLLSPSGAAEALARELGVVGLTGSMSKVDDLRRMVASALDNFGRIDGAVINTGILPSSLRADGSSRSAGPAYDPDDQTDLVDIDDVEWLAGYDMMFLSVVRLVRELIPVYRRQGKGVVVAISTFSAPEPRLAYPVSSCVRAGLGALIKLLADRHAREGIRFNCVQPGFLDNWELSHDVIKAIPMARAGRTDEIAETVKFLLSNASGYITGQSILVDGGINRSS